MVNLTICGALALAMLCLAGCDKTRADPPVPQTEAEKAPAVVLTSPMPNTTVPRADSVLTPPAAATAKDEPAARATGTLTRTQESNAMPMPGQVNNHSTTALDPAKGASAP